MRRNYRDSALITYYKTMKFLLLPILFASALPMILHAETAKEIAAKFDSQKVTAIEDYLKQNPKAEDADDALAILVDAQHSLGNLESVADLLLKRYDLQPKGDDADLRKIVTEILQPYFTIAGAANHKGKAKEFIARVKEDFAKHELSAQLGQLLDQMTAELAMPGAGDDLNIAFTALDGREVDLAKMKNKVVLVDFWATWCGPCKAEMPNVIATYGKYKEKGFEIVGISLDEDKAEVEKYVGEQKMTWPQYFDGKGWENKIAREYGISSIPATFLIGKDGKIIASNLRGEDLEKAVSDALAK